MNFKDAFSGTFDFSVGDAVNGTLSVFSSNPKLVNTIAFLASIADVVYQQCMVRSERQLASESGQKSEGEQSGQTSLLEDEWVMSEDSKPAEKKDAKISRTWTSFFGSFKPFKQVLRQDKNKNKKQESVEAPKDDKLHGGYHGFVPAIPVLIAGVGIFSDSHYTPWLCGAAVVVDKFLLPGAKQRHEALAEVVGAFIDRVNHVATAVANKLAAVTGRGASQ